MKSPREIFDELHEAVKNYDAYSQWELFAEEAVWEFPFAPPGVPQRIEGRDNIIAAASAGMERSRRKGRRITHYQDLVIYDTKDPDVIFTTFELHGKNSHTGETYQIPYMQFLKVRDGKIVILLDYFPGEVLSMAFENPIETAEVY